MREARLATRRPGRQARAAEKAVIPLWLILAGCGSASATSVGPPASPSKVVPAGPVPTQPFVDRPPGPIAGSYRVACPENEGEIIEFSLSKGKAVGRVVDAGTAKKYGFQNGEEVFRLTSDSYGDWVGEVHFRSVTGAQHWDGIRMVATDKGLNATMTNEPCYRNMPRVR